MQNKTNYLFIVMLLMGGTGFAMERANQADPIRRRSVSCEIDLDRNTVDLSNKNLKRVPDFSKKVPWAKEINLLGNPLIDICNLLTYKKLEKVRISFDSSCLLPENPTAERKRLTKGADTNTPEMPFRSLLAATRKTWTFYNPLYDLTQRKGLEIVDEGDVTSLTAALFPDTIKIFKRMIRSLLKKKKSAWEIDGEIVDNVFYKLFCDALEAKNRGLIKLLLACNLVTRKVKAITFRGMIHQTITTSEVPVEAHSVPVLAALLKKYMAKMENATLKRRKSLSVGSRRSVPKGLSLTKLGVIGDQRNCNSELETLVRRIDNGKVDTIIEMIRVLLPYCDLNKPFQHGTNMFEMLTESPKTKAAILKHKQFNPNQKVKTGKTLLAWSLTNDKELFRKLLQIKGVDATSKTNGSLLAIAAGNQDSDGDLESVKWLLKDPKVIDLYALHHAPIDINELFEGQTALSRAVIRNDFKMVEFLMSMDALNLNVPDIVHEAFILFDHNCTPLHRAVEAADPASGATKQILQLILNDRRTNLNVQNAIGRKTPLICAVGADNFEVVEMLLAEVLKDRLSLDIEDKDGFSASKVALHCEENGDEIREALKEAGAIQPGIVDKIVSLFA